MNRGGKRPGSGRKPHACKVKTKQVRGVPVELFEKLHKIKRLQKLTIEFWFNLTIEKDEREIK